MQPGETSSGPRESRPCVRREKAIDVWESVELKKNHGEEPTAGLKA